MENENQTNISIDQTDQNLRQCLPRQPQGKYLEQTEKQYNGK